ncbi:MAG: hypothetical protein H7099_17530 [Gemmatimonadaceae bacterium]|nr:hypothetical protein [Gemmatimonadaceae bacterium]
MSLLLLFGGSSAPSINAGHNGSVSVGGCAFGATASVQTSNGGAHSSNGGHAPTVAATTAHSNSTSLAGQIAPTAVQMGAHGGSLRLLESVTTALAHASQHSAAVRLTEQVISLVSTMTSHAGSLRLTELLTVTPAQRTSHGGQLRLSDALVSSLAHVTSHADAARLLETVLVLISASQRHDGLLRLDGATLASAIPPLDASHGGQLLTEAAFLDTLSQATAHTGAARLLDNATPIVRASAAHASALRGLDAWASMATLALVPHSGSVRLDGASASLQHLFVVDNSSILHLLGEMLAEVRPPIDGSHGGSLTLGGGMLGVQLVQLAVGGSTTRLAEAMSPGLQMHVTAGGSVGQRDLFHVVPLAWTAHTGRVRLLDVFDGETTAAVRILMRARRWLLPVARGDAMVTVATHAPAHVLAFTTLPATIHPDDE